MKIAVLLSTRGNPKRLCAVLETAKATASDNHEVRYVVAVDTDDWHEYNLAYERAYYRLPNGNLDPIFSIAPRPPGIPACWNRLPAMLLEDYDAYVMLADDSLVGSMHWDETIALYMAESHYPPALRCFAWNDVANPGMPTLIGVSKEWLALAGPLLDDRFPFWFSDIGFAETWSFVTGNFLPILPITLNHKLGKHNPRLRDMGFWWDFYAFTRAERLADAKRIRGALGIGEPPALSALRLAYERRDAQGREASLHFDGPPTPEYLRAKSRAQSLMKKEAA